MPGIAFFFTNMFVLFKVEFAEMEYY